MWAHSGIAPLLTGPCGLVSVPALHVWCYFFPVLPFCEHMKSHSCPCRPGRSNTYMECFNRLPRPKKGSLSNVFLET